MSAHAHAAVTRTLRTPTILAADFCRCGLVRLDGVAVWEEPPISLRAITQDASIKKPPPRL